MGPITLTTAVVPAPAASPPPAHAHSLRRPRKRRRVEASEDLPSPVSDVYDDKADAEESRRVDADAEEEAEGEDDGGAPEEDDEDEEDEDGEGEADGEDGEGGRRRGGTQEQRRERWRECALYREAQRHAGTPNARKTHRHLGIFGLRGFPADIEHMRDFVPPEWALPHGDLRLVQDGADVTIAVPIVDVVGRAGETPHVGEGVGAVGAEGVDKEAGQAHLNEVVMTVTVAEEGDGEKALLEVGPDKSDSVMTVDSPKTVDSQETEEDLTLFV